MTVRTSINPSSPSILDHDLERFFPELLKFESTPEMERSEVYRRIKPDVDRILNAVVQEDFAQSTSLNDENGHAKAWTPNIVKALAWNIERGIRFDGIADALKNHDRLNDKDLLLLTELDHGMARSGNRFVARELARELDLNYAFAPVYIALQKGSGVESEIEGDNTKSIHGLAMFSRYLICRAC